MTHSGSVWRAVAGNPFRFLLSRWPWRCLAYLLGTVVLAPAAWLAMLPLAAFPPTLVLAGVPIGALERRRLGLFERAPMRSPHAAAPGGVGAWLRRRLVESATWRELGYTVCLLSVLFAIDLVGLFVLFVCVTLLALPLRVAAGITNWVNIQLGGSVVDTMGEAWLAAAIALPVTIVTVYALCLLAAGQAAFARWLLGPTQAELNLRVEELSTSRMRLVDAFEAERRRIERDLHDGAQQHLVLLNMNLGLMEAELGGQDQRMAELARDARRQARQALTAIRELIRGIHPQVLTDLGLAAAVGELAERCPVPVELDLALDRRLPVAVESTAYFVVSEAMTNTVRHAGAGRITVSGGFAGGRLRVAIGDDGRGGADPARGSGLRGLADRVAVLDGTLVIDSPERGPTTVRIELPCHCE
ncbi:sensor histidine kinase [Microtetraspora glauca]|uniref:histidine kinase n=1 Tax=Microtetraspora glauca TaxID=1996 RepID=A0ABV3GU21_MICGL